VALGEGALQLETLTVLGTGEGQARALNQQRSAQNLTNIISADLSGQFPDKTIADAVERLPGVTVETDTDTGGSEGRYITIRGLNADFNAVSINGMRVAVSDFGGTEPPRCRSMWFPPRAPTRSRSTEALRPDQDGDGIGGAVDIITRSPLRSRSGRMLVRRGRRWSERTSSTVAAGTGDFPWIERIGRPRRPSAGFGASAQARATPSAVAASASIGDRAFVGQRIGAGGWAADSGPGGSHYPISLNLQDCFDDVSAVGFNGTLGKWRPSAEHKLRLDVGISQRETEQPPAPPKRVHRRRRRHQCQRQRHLRTPAPAA